MKTGSDAIVQLLAAKHSKDVFVPECEDGATIFGPHSRLDVWAMRRSWAHPWSYGYEVKVDRQDFLRDEKWEAYLPMCHYFSFVCPRGLIEPGELPEGVGLLWAASTGTRLFTKRKAPRRDIEINPDVYRYILMSRATVHASVFYAHDEMGPDAKIAFWKRWLAQRRESREVGHAVSAKVREIVAEEVSARHLAESKVATYDRLRVAMGAVGLDPDVPAQDWTIQRALDRLTEAKDLRRRLIAVRDATERALDELQETP